MVSLPESDPQGARLAVASDVCKAPAPGVVRPPEITVLMPVRNAEPTLDAAVGSITAQTWSDFELLVIDDHSTDASPELLDAWRRRDRRIRIEGCRGSGLIDALNTGLAMARAPLVARLDADDLAHPRRLELQRAFVRHRPGLTVVSCLVESIPRGRVMEGYRVYERWLNGLTEPAAISREIFVESPLPHPSVLYRRDAILDAGGYRDAGWAEDYDLWLRLHGLGHRFAKVPEVLLYWRDLPSRLSRTHPRYAVERFLAAKAHFLARGPLRRRPAVIWGAGPIGRRISRHLLREGVEILAFIDVDRRKIGRTLRSRPILAPGAIPIADGAVVLAAVASRHARELIRRRLESRFLREGKDFVCVA